MSSMQKYMGLKPQMSMSFGELIEKLEEGWGFRRPYTVQSIGRGLRQLAEQRGVNLDTSVEVKYEAGSYGYGPNFHYTYDWEVVGVELPAANAQPGPVEAAFGCAVGNLPAVTPIPGGFRVGYVW